MYCKRILLILQFFAIRCMKYDQISVRNGLHTLFFFLRFYVEIEFGTDLHYIKQ